LADGHQEVAVIDALVATIDRDLQAAHHSSTSHATATRIGDRRWPREHRTTIRTIAGAGTRQRG
jgi:hypothetical protein